MPAGVSAESKPIVPESVLKKRRTKEAIAAKLAVSNEASRKVCQARLEKNVKSTDELVGLREAELSACGMARYRALTVVMRPA